MIEQIELCLKVKGASILQFQPRGNVWIGLDGSGKSTVLRTRGIFSSHGKIMESALFPLPIHQGGVLLVDEPESRQDQTGVLRIREGFDLLCNQGGQVITASHDPFFMQNAHLVELVLGYSEQLRNAFYHLLCGDQA